MVDDLLRRSRGMKLFGCLCVFGVIMSARALEHEAGFEYRELGYVEKEIIILRFTKEEVVVPAYIDGVPVTTMTDEGAEWDFIVRRVSLPPTMTYIAERFVNATNLVSVVVQPGSGRVQINESFYGCPKLREVSLPDNVYRIDRSSFCSCDSLTEFKVPSSVESFELGSCKNLKKLILSDNLSRLGVSCMDSLVDVELPNSLKYLYVFDCGSLKTITLPAGIEEFGLQCFEGCTNLEAIVQLGGTVFPRIEDLPRLKSVTISDDVGYIERLCDCELLEEVNIPRSVTNMGNSCFSGCKSLRGNMDLSGLTCEYLPDGLLRETGVECVTLPAGIKEIGLGAFASCQNLKSIEIPESVEVIHSSAFRECNILKKIVLKNVKQIGVRAFEYCTGLENVEILGELKSLCNGAFLGCVNLANVRIEGVGFDVPDSIDSGRSVREPFQYCSNIVSVAVSPLDAYGYPRDIFPDARSKIQELEVVEGVTNVSLVFGAGLKRLVLPATMESFSAPVYNNPNLGEIIVSAENPRFAAKDGILYDKGMTTVIACGCAKTKVELPETVKAIGKNAFRNCIRIEDVKFPMSVGDIGGSSFYGCTNLASMTLSECLTNIAASAFYKCARLQDVEFPCALENIGDNAFAYCNNLSVVRLHDGLLVGRGAFSYCSGLRNAIVGKVKVSDVRTGQGLFGQCANLTDVVIDDDASWLGWSSAFGGCKKLQKMKLPRAWKVIPSQIFYGCVSLSDFETGNEIESIDNYAFYNCSSLQSVRIPAATTNVANYAFYGVAMKEVVFEGDLPVLQSRCYLIDNAAKVYYPRQFAEHYMPVVPAEKFGGYTEDNQFVKSGEGRLMAIPTSWVNEVFDAHPELKEVWSGNVGGFIRQPTDKSYGGEGGAFVWHDYVAGTDPTDPEDVFTATIEFEDGMPKIKYAPELTEHQKALRKYVVYGKKNLADAAWSIVSEGSESEYSFFKVGVDLK